MNHSANGNIGQQGAVGEGPEDVSLRNKAKTDPTDGGEATENASSGVINPSPRRRVRKSVALSFSKYAGKKAETKAIMEHAHTDNREQEKYRRGKKAVALSFTK